MFSSASSRSKNLKVAFWVLVFLICFLPYWQLWREPGVLMGFELKGSYEYWEWLKAMLTSWDARYSFGYATHTFYVSPGQPEIFAYSLAMLWPFFFLAAVSSVIFGENGFTFVYILSFFLQFVAVFYLLPTIFKISVRERYLATLAVGSLLVFNAYKLSIINFGANYSLNYALWIFWVATLIRLFRSIIDGKKATILFWQAMLLTWLMGSLAIGLLVITFYSGLFIGLYYGYLIWRQKDKSKIRALFKYLLMGAGVQFLYFAHIIIPTLLSRESSLDGALGTFSQPSDISLGQIISLNLYTETGSWQNAVAWLIPLLAFSGWLLMTKKKKIIIGLIFIIGITVTLGGSPATQAINEWMRQNIPLFYLTRSAHRFMLLIQFCYVISIGWLIIYTWRKRGVKLACLLAVLVLAVSLVTAWKPIIQVGNFDNNLVKISLPAQYFALDDWLDDNLDSNDQVLFMDVYHQQIFSGTFDWYDQPFLRSIWKSPYYLLLAPANSVKISGMNYSFAERYLDYLLIVACTEPVQAKELLYKSGIKYLVFDSADQLIDYDIFKGLLLDDDNYSVVEGVEGFEIIKNERAFTAFVDPKPDFVVGDLWTLTNPQTKPGAILLNQQLNPVQALSDCLDCRVIFDRLEAIDLIGQELVGSATILKTSNKLGDDGVRADMWVDRSALSPQYMKGVVLTEGLGAVGTDSNVPLVYNLTDQLKKNEEYVLLLKFMGSNSWTMDLQVGDITLKLGDDRLRATSRWWKLTTVRPENKDLKMIFTNTSEKELLIEGVIAVPVSIYNQVEEQVNTLLSGRANYQIDELLTEVDQPSVVEVEVGGVETAKEFQLEGDSTWLNIVQATNQDWRASKGNVYYANYFYPVIFTESEGSLEYAYTLSKVYRVSLLIMIVALSASGLIVLRESIFK